MNELSNPRFKTIYPEFKKATYLLKRILKKKDSFEKQKERTFCESFSGFDRDFLGF